MKKKSGFTLAEVLITLTIIGVVAAITLPSLNNNITDRGIEAGLKTFYNTLSSAADTYFGDPDQPRVISLLRTNPDQFASTLKVTQRCSSNTAEGCFATAYTNINSAAVSVPDGGVSYALPSGAVFNINTESNDARGKIIFDINGTKGPNIFGRDYQVVNIYSDGTVDVIDRNARLSNSVNTTLNTYANNSKTIGATANALVATNSNMGSFIRNGFSISRLPVSNTVDGKHDGDFARTDADTSDKLEHAFGDDAQVRDFGGPIEYKP